MIVPREHVVTITIAVIAVLFIIGGYASMSGLSTYEAPLRIEMTRATYSQGDVFDANVNVGAVTMMSDESVMVYVDGVLSGAIVLKQYFDDNRVDYGTDYRSNIEIMSTLDPIMINLADHVSLETLKPGPHIVRVEFSRSDAVAESEFKVK